MRSGVWDGAVSTDNVRVFVNGVQRPVDNVRIQSGMRDGHPLSDSTSWCIEATIDWADPDTVAAGAPEIFTGTSWVPRPGDKVEIFTGDGVTDTWWRQHVGWVDDTSGSFADGTAQSTTVDGVEELDKPVQFGAMLAYMTPTGAPGDSIRYQGLQGIWYVDRMLRDESSGARGWHIAPPITWQTIAATSGLGSVHPEVGTLTRAGKSGAPEGPNWRVGADGHPYPANYVSVTSFKGSVATRKFVVTIGLSGDAGTDFGALAFRDDAGERGLEVACDGAGSIYTRHGSGTRQYVPIAGATRVAVSYERVNTTDQRATLRFDDGREYVHNTTTGALPAYWVATQVEVLSTTGGPFTWWMVEDEKPASQEWASLNHVPTARIRVDDFNWWYGSRDQPREAAAESLMSQLEAECAAAWLDEDGHFQWCGRKVLDNQAPAQTVTSELDLDELSWETRRRMGARSLTINYLHPRIEMDQFGNCTRELWSSDGLDVEPGESDLVAVTVPPEEDWIAEDLVPHHIYQWGLSWTEYGVGSTFGGTQYRKSNSDEAAWGQFVDCTMTKTGLRDYEVTFGLWSSVSSVYRLKSSYPPSGMAYARTSSPLVLRGRAKLVWRERQLTVSTGNTAGGPRYVHEAGWRMQDRGVAMDHLRDWLVDQLANPEPTVNVTLAHDPRRQIGDKIRVEDRDVTGTWVEMLVQERDTNVSGFTDTVRGRVTAHGALSDVSLHAPSGHTALTPATDWTRGATP